MNLRMSTKATLFAIGIVLFGILVLVANAQTGPRVGVVVNVNDEQSRVATKESLQALFGGPGSVKLIDRPVDNPAGAACVEVLFLSPNPVVAKVGGFNQGVKEVFGAAARDQINTMGQAGGQVANKGGIWTTGAGTVSREAGRRGGDAAQGEIVGNRSRFPNRFVSEVAIRGGCPGNQPLSVNDAYSFAIKVAEIDGMMVVESVGGRKDRQLHKLAVRLKLFKADANEQLSQAEVSYAAMEVIAAHAKGELLDIDGQPIDFPAGDELRHIYKRVMFRR